MLTDLAASRIVVCSGTTTSQLSIVSLTMLCAPFSVLSLTVVLLGSTIPGSSLRGTRQSQSDRNAGSGSLLARLLLGETLLDQIPIVNTLAGLALAQLAAAALMLALKLDGRQLDLELDLVVKAR